MKKINSIITIIIVSIAIATPSFAQDSDNATTSGTIVTPIAIQSNTELNFGNIAVNGSEGSVTLASTDSGRSTDAANNVTLPSVGGTVSAATFDVTGQANYAYSISLPDSPFNIQNSGDTDETMSVSAFESTPTVSAGGSLDSSGDQTISVGATLTVSGNQAAGTYTSDTGFDVTVNYN